ncbi:MAG: cytochrome c family protein [Pirellulaceae bacterium]
MTHTRYLNTSAVLAFVLLLVSNLTLFGQTLQCDPAKVLTTETCVRCHGNEVAQWKQSKHFETFESLSKNPRAQEITSKLGLTSVKRNEVCTQCHFTVQQQDGGREKPIAGISCESCHGASKDWLNVHNDYGGPLATRDSESPEHRQQRLAKSVELGMKNTTNIYLIARSCLQCHTVPDEKLVDVGGHHAGSNAFELVSWSQGIVRHNFARTNGSANAQSTQENLRLMFVVGLIADLEFSTRAVANATQKGTFGLASAERAARVALQLYEVQKLVNNEHINRALLAFSNAELRTNNSEQLIAIADEIRAAGQALAERENGNDWSAIDSLIPPANQFKN